MKKHLLALTITTLTCSNYAFATESQEIDMSSPTEGGMLQIIREGRSI